jgi:thiol-disulfide isomerase/thioredoxin
MLVLVLSISFVVLTMYPLDSLGKAQVSGSDSDNFLTIPIEGLDGRPIYLEDYKENIVVLEFMATWCLTCAQQEPILQELHTKYQDENLVVLAVTIDPTYDTPDVLSSFVEKNDIPWQITRDTSLMMTKYFQVSEISTTIIISPEGEVENEFTGLTDLDTLSRAVNVFL